MEYFEAVNYLAGLQDTRPKFGTGTTAEMLDALGNPHDGPRYVQIAGSNGKGSTACMLARVLREAGFDVGLYTSPDLNGLRERIQVNGRKIPKRELTALVERIRPHVADRAAADDAPTQFEVVTALGLAYFGRRDVDVAVLEVGIGGRHDATSVVDPVASGVTSVSLEHTDILGDTTDEIARDKAQVAPTDRPLVTGTTGEALSAIREETNVVTVGEEDADVLVEPNGLTSRTEESIAIESADWRVETQLSLLGRHQAVNAGIAATLARQFADIDERTLARGLRKAHWPGRFEIVDSDPCVVLDGAHNPDACSKLATLVERYDYDDLHLVFGVLQDKDHKEMAKNLPSVDGVVLCRPAVDRAANLDSIRRILARRTGAPIDIIPSVLDAVERAIHRADPDDLVLVTGSLYTVSEARDRWTRPVIPKRMADPTSVTELSSFGEQLAEVDVSEYTVKTYCRPIRAERLKALMLSLGGTAAVSDIDGVHQHVDVVLNGSAAEFRRLIDLLEVRAGELSHIAAQLRAILNFDDERETSSAFPWDHPAIMGILNVTPDSFHDGGQYDCVEDAVARANRLAAEGASIVDVGGESTRPGADPVSAEREIDRVVPVVERLADRSVSIAVDTRKAAVAEAAIEAGADAINDVTGLSDPDMRRVIADHDVPVIVMHSIDAPVNPDRSVTYDDVVEDVIGELTERILLAERAGVDRERIVVDPGVGFGKSAAESFELINRLDEFHALECPILIGHSHKSMFDRVSCGLDDRLAPTIAATALAADRGADIIRVHDVAENVAAMRTAEAMPDWT
ncbi:dihydropteroate synthase [Halosolutus gelatinilyticus]|uniref:dihydropteroate synthase n=1 Tax=Halosolutus gelatinilyticus TaxID=2931975 RepID=UPI001FF23673|nr:dihydropteroate synthase [Halosolutus gelatinilyticus]